MTPAIRRALATAGVGLVEVDLECGVVAHANATARRVLGPSDRAVSGAELFDLVHEDDRLDAPAVRLQLAAGVPFRRDVRLRDDEDRWVRLTVGPASTARGVPDRYAYALVRDVTREKRTGSPTLFQLGSFFDRSDLRVAIHGGPAHAYVYASSAYRAAVGRPIHEGEPARGALPEAACAVLHEAYSSREAVTEAAVLHTAGEPAAPLSLTALPWFEPTGAVGGVVTIALDADTTPDDRVPSETERRSGLLEGTLREGTFYLTLAPPVRVDTLDDGGLDAAPARLEMSARAAELVGLDRASLGERQPAGSSHPLVPPFLRALVRGSFRLVDWPVTVAIEGADRHLLVNAASEIRDGELAAVWGSLTDITERVVLRRRLARALDDVQDEIGRDLHDGVGPYLTAVRMLSEKLADDVAAVDPVISASAAKLATFAGAAAHQVAALYRGLSPTALVQNGLHAALEQLCEDTSGLPDVSCTFEGADGPVEAPVEAQLQLYRIAQEAVHNAVKHGRPERIWIGLDRPGGGVRLEVRDDGQGFAVDRRPLRGHHIGLESMRVRAQTIGGDLEVESAPGRGTRVVCWVAPP